MEFLNLNSLSPSSFLLLPIKKEACDVRCKMRTKKCKIYTFRTIQIKIKVKTQGQHYYAVIFDTFRNTNYGLSFAEITNLRLMLQQTGYMEQRIETERLIIRPVTLEDQEGFFALDSDPEVMRYVGNKLIRHKEEAENTIRFIQEQYATNGTGRWSVTDKKNNDFIGWTGIKLIREELNNHSNFYELGYRLLRRHWGQGFATEAALACLEYGFRVLKPGVIFAIADAGNKGSDHVLQKCGLSLSAHFDYEGTPHNWYHITKAAWELRKK